MLDAARLPRQARVAGTILLGGLALIAGPARADRILLRGGGQIRGKLIAEKAHPGRLVFVGEAGKTPLNYTKDQIIQVTPEPGPLDEYVLLRESVRPDAEAEYNLGVWCEDHKLADLAAVHFEAAVKRDGAFAPAREKLGHVFQDGRWLDADEAREAQGMVKYRGRWVTPEEKERKDAQAAAAAEGASWSVRIRALRDGYLKGPDARSREAERRLLEIREPVAVAPVLKILGYHPIPAVRMLAARVLGPIPGQPAASGLVGLLLAELDEAVRSAAMTEIARREVDEVVPPLTRALRSAQAEVVNRAAWGLANLNAVATVPRLVPALVTIEYRVMMTPGGGGTGGGSGGIGMSFNTVSPSSGPDYGGYSGGSIAVPSGAVVGPNAVGIGATSVPYGAINNSGIDLGGGGSRVPVPRLVPIEHRNAEVLAALVKMTGRDFGFDIPTWKQWIATSFRVEARPVRRVPQP